MTTEGDIAYLDANVFIDAVEGSEAVSAPTRQLLDAARGRPGALITSELTLAEVLAPGNDRPIPADLRSLYLDLIVGSGSIELKPINRDVLFETARLRQTARLKLVDAIHLATASLSGCRFFVTRDGDFKRMPAGIELLVSDAIGLARVTAKIQ